MTRTVLMLGLLSIAGTGTIQPPTLVSFPTQDGGTIYAHSYGYGAHAVVLGSNGCGAKESWEPQAQRLVAEGYKVLAIDFRGNGQSHGGPQSRADDYHLDILAAVRYLYLASTSVSVIGASCAGDAAAQASVDARPGEIESIILLAQGGIEHPERIFATVPGERLMREILRFLAARNDR